MRVGNRNEVNAVWSYEAPYAEGNAYAGYLAFYWDRMDSWLADDQVFTEQPESAVDR